jgi:glycosyltransferase involved in cell wall biosynthesis
MTTSLLIVHPFVQAYREGLYSELAKHLGEHDVLVRVAQGPPPPSLAGRKDATAAEWAIPTPTTWVRVGGKDVALRRIPHTTDLVIVEQAIKNVETYPLLARKSLGGPAVAMWGHGRSYSTPQGPALAATKQFLTRRCDWFFAYSQAGADHVISHGFPAARVSVLNNTIDTAALRRDLDSVSDEDAAAFSRQQGLTPGRTALFLGGVDNAKGIDFLLESAVEAEKRLPGFILLVGGAGDQQDDVGQAQRAGAPIRALGRLDGHAKALALRAADVMAIPSSVGLVAVDSLVAGVPIVTRANGTHGPEADYLTRDLAVWLVATADAAEYAHAVTDLLADTTHLAEMRSRCRGEAPRYGLDHMVDAFVEGVLAWQDVIRAGL